MKINLPDLQRYGSYFKEKGITNPLPISPFSPKGVLNKLPTPPAGKSGWLWTQQSDPLFYNQDHKWPKITIVTPSYNQGAFIEQTIRSVLLQNYPNLEYIIMDGGSTDQTIEILEKYSPWISYWESEKDKGQGHAINKGFSLASGQYCAWINSDDYYLKNVFGLVSETFKKTGAKFVYGYGQNFVVEENKFEFLKVLPLIDYFLRIPSLIQPSCFWDHEIHQPIWEQLQCSLDYELWLRMVKGKKRKLIKKPLSVTQVHLDAKTHDPKMKNAWEKDHSLICDKEAHGIANNWNRLVFLRRIFSGITHLKEKMRIGTI